VAGRPFGGVPRRGHADDAPRDRHWAMLRATRQRLRPYAVRLYHGRHHGIHAGEEAQVAVPMHPFWLEQLAKLPRRSVTLLYERSGAPFKTTAAIQERFRKLMSEPAVQEVIADLIAREMIVENATFTFHGLRKNACCYVVEYGINDSEIGEILGMSPDMVRHYSKRERALMVARGAAGRMTGGKITPINSKIGQTAVR
jgi:hypothetical protein